MAIISKTRWQSIQTLLDEVLDLPESERVEFLSNACNNQPDLKQEILNLLEAEKKAPTLLNRPAQELYQEFLTSKQKTVRKESTLENTIIGAFKLIKEIGHGGMGAVYLAERCAGDFEQTVAIKVLNNSTQNKDLLERFKREQQLLASLDHPNIAKLFDGGISENGQAYLIMEYVDGSTIDIYCEENKLEINQRLQLIQQVAKAVDFAHKHLIIHRDLKPSNILVKNDGTVKLLDFSIAKLMDEQDAINLTQLGHTPMTPGYAAPEQLQNKPISITTDVYQLGLVAYLLLTGVPAHDKANISLASLVQQVCTEIPPQPSRALRNAKNSRKLRGDLDAIILKMLQLEPSQRYSSMDAVLQDFQAYFNLLPVRARHPSWVYLSKRGIQRHWKFAIVASLFLTVLTSYAITATWQAHIIELALQKSRAEQAKAEQVSAFLMNVFNAADPNISGFESVTAKQLLENGEARIIDELQHVPSVRNHMLNILARIWQRQGDYAHANEILEKALTSAREANNTHTSEFATSLSLTGNNYLDIGENNLALQFTQQGVDLYENLIREGTEEENDKYAYVLLKRAMTLSTLGRTEEARPIVKKVIKILDNNSKLNYEYLTYAYSELALIQHVSGEFTEARAHMEKAAELQKQVTGENHTHYTTLITNLAVSYQDAEQFDEAERLAREALRIHERVFEPDHPLSVHAKRTTAVILHRKGNLDEAEKLLRNIIALESKLDQPNFYQNLATNIQLGSVLQDKGKLTEAESQYRGVIEQLKNQPNDEMLGRTLTKVASLKFQQEKYPESLALFEQALTLLEKENLVTTITEGGLARVLLELGRTSEALAYAKHAREKRKQVFQENHSWVVEANLIYALTLFQTNKIEEARNILNSSLEKAKDIPGFQFGERLQLYQAAIELKIGS